VHWYDQYIEKVPGLQGGEPVIAGTRTPVQSVIGYDNIYNGDLTEIQRALSHLALYQIGAALDYYRDHQAEVDVYVARNDEALHQFLATP
jgi:uncharacterized protein (DUF433 family)